MHPINESKVTAVRLRGAGSRWHPVTDFHFYGDGKSESLTLSGVTWITSKGDRCTVPQDAIYVCEGDWSCFESAEENAADGLMPRPGRADDSLQRATAWLENALQDGQPHSPTILRHDAREDANISPSTLQRAYESLPGHVPPFRLSVGWGWQLNPINEPESDVKGSTLIEADGAE